MGRGCTVYGEGSIDDRIPVKPLLYGEDILMLAGNVCTVNTGLRYGHSHVSRFNGAYMLYQQILHIFPK